tara:strand:+ start:1524 stop:2024 length:501 start_codon:yes stop_codon:yes gene_type:complete
MELIASYTATGSVANISFTSIAADWTDLILKFSLRSSVTDSSDPYDLVLTLNATSTIASKVVRGNGQGAASFNSITDRILRAGAVPSNWTANTFNNGEIYFPSYTSSNYKSWSSDAVTENNATTADMSIAAGLTSITAAITSITIAGLAGNLVEHSTAYLYGVSNA